MASQANRETRGTHDPRANESRSDQRPQGRGRGPAPSMHDRVRNQLTNGALRAKITVDELDDLGRHISKLKGLLT